MIELLARVRVALRHRRQPGAAETVTASLVVGDIEVDVARHRVVAKGAEIELTPREFAFLAVLAQHPGRMMSHRMLLQKGWGPAESAPTNRRSPGLACPGCCDQPCVPARWVLAGCGALEFLMAVRCGIIRRGAGSGRDSSMKRLFAAVVVVIGAFMLFSDPAAAHPLGNFTVNTYSGLVVRPRSVEIRFVLDMAEIPTFQKRAEIDTDGDGRTSAARRTPFGKLRATRFASTSTYGSGAGHWRRPWFPPRCPSRPARRA